MGLLSSYYVTAILNASGMVIYLSFTTEPFYKQGK